MKVHPRWSVLSQSILRDLTACVGVALCLFVASANAGEAFRKADSRQSFACEEEPWSTTCSDWSFSHIECEAGPPPWGGMTEIHVHLRTCMTYDGCGELRESVTDVNREPQLWGGTGACT
jgi:hypothetical protein